VCPNDCDSYARIDQEKYADASDEPSYCPWPEGNSSEQSDGNRNKDISATCDHAPILPRMKSPKLFFGNAGQPQAGQNRSETDQKRSSDWLWYSPKRASHEHRPAINGISRFIYKMDAHFSRRIRNYKLSAEGFGTMASQCAHDRGQHKCFWGARMCGAIGIGPVKPKRDICAIEETRIVDTAVEKQLVGTTLPIP
jgi:hypothetical protein